MDLISEIRKTYPFLKNYFTPKKLSEFLSKNYTDIYLYHFGLGTWVRENIIPNPDYKDLYNLFRSLGITHTDDMSFLILSLFYIDLKTERIKKQSR